MMWLGQTILNLGARKAVMYSFKVFAEENFDHFLEARLEDLQRTIESQPENYVLNVSPSEYELHLVERFEVDPPELHFEQITMEREERNIPAEHFPRTYFVREGASYPRPVFIFHIPIGGDSSLLRYSPNPRQLWTEEMRIREDNLVFEIVDFSNDPERIKQRVESTKNSLGAQLAYLRAQARQSNDQLPERVKSHLDGRKKRIMQQNELVEGIGIPLRRTPDLPETFAVPASAVPKKIRPKPTAADIGYQPDPTLAENDYRDIIQIVHDVGRMLERHPSTYEGKDEEDLRDIVLTFLQPRFEGSATGETFNKGGKTDILLRYEGTNSSLRNVSSGKEQGHTFRPLRSFSVI